VPLVGDEPEMRPRVQTAHHAYPDTSTPLPPQSPTFLTQNTWHFNSVTGLDSNSGLTPASALKTFAEYEKRIGHFNTVAPTGGVLNLFIDSASMPPTDPFNMLAVLETGATVNLQGTSTLVRSGTFDAAGGVSPINAAANQAFLVKDSSVASWAGDVAHFIQVPTGPRAGTAAWVAKDIGGGTHQARTSNWVIITPPSVAPVPTAPANGDPYQILNKSSFSWGSVVLFGSGTAIATLNLLDVQVLGVSLIWNQENGVALIPYRSRFDAGLSSPTFLENSCLTGGLEQFGGATEVDAGLLTVLSGIGAIATGLVLEVGAVVLDFDVLFQGVSAFSNGGALMLGAVALFDVPADPLSFSPAGDALLVGVSFPNQAVAPSSAALQPRAFGTARLYGLGQAGAGVHLGLGATMTYRLGSPPSITGAGGDFLLGPTALGRAFDDTQGAGATFTATRPTTWANLALPIAGPGFAGTAHAINFDAHMCGY
jgi:hypothetical protein